MKGPKKLISIAVVLLIVASTFGCYPALEKGALRPEEALRQVGLLSPKFRDDMDPDSLSLAVRRNLDYLNRLAPETVFRYGTHDFTCRQVRESQEAFLNLLSKGLDAGKLSREIRKQFRVYRATGRVGNTRVLFTGYFEPVYEGSLIPDQTFRYPLYRQPDDLIRIDLSPFSERFEGRDPRRENRGQAGPALLLQVPDRGGEGTGGEGLRDCLAKRPGGCGFSPHPGIRQAETSRTEKTSPFTTRPPTDGPTEASGGT